jgi:diguanylate cyclase
LFRSVPGSPLDVSTVRRLSLDPVLVGSVLWAALGCILFFVAADDSATQVQAFWVFQPPLDAVLAWCSWRVYRIATGVIRRFWLVLTVVGTLFLVGDIQQAVLTLLDPAGKSTTGETVQTACVVLGLAAIVVNMLIHPHPGRSGRDRLAFWLDAATVLVAGGVLAWCFLIAPTGQHGSDLVGTIVVAGVALTAAFASVKMVLTGNAPMHTLAAAPMIGSAIAMGAGAFLAPVDAGGALPPLVYAVRLLPSLLICSGPRIQEVLARFGSAPFGSRRRKPYSLLPYGSILITFGVLIFILPGGVNARLWGVVAGLVVITGLVAGRQLVAFHDNVRLINRLDHTLGELREHEARLFDQALFDGLTKLANRTHFGEQVTLALAGIPRSGPVSVLFIDLDDFKTVNDTLGHAAGDALLVGVADRLRGAVRSGDVVARLGGDEFAVLLRGSAELEAGQTAQRILDGLAAPIPIHQTDILVRASIGVAVAGAGADLESLMRDADIALYEAKARGKGGWTHYVPEMGLRIRRNAELTSQLGEALAAGQFHLVYQPIVRLADGDVTGVEALLRWNRGPGQPVLSPTEFIPIAEECGLIVPIGRWVLWEACRQAAEWHRTYPLAAALVVNVNVAGRQLREPHFADTVADALTAAGLPARCLTIEVTETAVLADDGAIRTLDALRALGVGLALDDFGTAASSLGLLLTCPVSTLKLDRSFVEAIVTVDRQAAVAMAVSQIAHALHLASVAEGVETLEQAEVLRDLGYQSAQGFLYSRPLPASGIDELLAFPHALVGRELTAG